MDGTQRRTLSNPCVEGDPERRLLLGSMPTKVTPAASTSKLPYSECPRPPGSGSTPRRAELFPKEVCWEDQQSTKVAIGFTVRCRHKT